MATFAGSFETFAGAVAFLGDANEKRIGYETVVRRINADTVAVKYHATDVVTYQSDGVIILNNGGWPTQNTRERIKRFSPVNVYQKQNQEYWEAKGAFRRVTRERAFGGTLVLSAALLRGAR